MSVADWIDYQVPSGRYTFSKEDVKKEFPTMTGHAIDTSISEVRLFAGLCVGGA